MAREYWSWINGQYANDSHISASSGAVLHGYGAFETIYYGAGKIHFLREHLDRLNQAAEFYSLHHQTSANEIESAITGLITRNQLPEARVRLTLTARENDYSATHKPSDLTINAQPYERKDRSIALITAPAQQLGCPLRKHKSTSYASYILAKQYALQLGADDTLLRDYLGNYIECSSSNIFLAKDGAWFTPDLSEYGLAGIQRQVILEAMDKLQIPHSVVPINALDYDYGFISNSLIGIQAIERIDSQELLTNQVTYLKQLREIELMTS